MESLLANSILVLHFAFVLFVVGGLALTWAGGLLGWRWVRRRSFRLAHLGAIAFVVAEALAGVMCPLTVWEDALRGRDTEIGFIARWLHAVMFYTLPEWVFTLVYVVFALVVAATFWIVPVAPREKARHRCGPGGPHRG